MTALDGIKVIDLGQFYFGPYCSMLMARMGADVIKVEAPDGDPYRRLPTVDDEGVAVQFQLINAGKRFIRLDLKQEAGREVLLKLVRQADVLVQNLSPGAMDRFGLGYETLSRANPRLIMASGTGYGSYGPYAGETSMDMSIQARTAFMSTTGFDDGPPLRTGPSVVDFLGGSHLLAGVMTALYQRERTGEGQHVEIALQDAAMTSLTSNIAGYVNSGGTIPERTGNRNGGLAVSPYNAYRTNDGWVALLCPTDAHWQRLCALMGNPEADDSRFATMAVRCAEMEAVDKLVEQWTVTLSKHEIGEVLRDAHIPAAPVITLPEVLEDPHVAERPVLRRMHDEKGEWLTWGNPLVLSSSAMVEPTRPGRLGAHTEEVLVGELGFSPDELSALRESGVV
ncbi:CoA transferase [Streptomyces sp. NPDC002790]|uniref:CaiB/BaiF CoA transferase family protein n=1 Tax=Streptomyces sp. NPDC002790 TaxID=3154431 RepID=UPI00332C1796